ncbi:MAG: cupredoxin domain-containing protein [Actinobacteria bacterium]|nr:cupredoxin domain-containing protein [Actinomycetota bacterium]
MRTGLILLIVVLAFVASYQIATAGEGATPAGTSVLPALASSISAGPPACACCPGGSSEPIEGAAAVENGVQRITVDTSAGYYDPNTIRLAAGIPAEITFTQASGCLAQVESPDFGFSEDLTAGDVTVRIEADKLVPGTYGFSCGMQMAFGTIIVE